MFQKTLMLIDEVKYREGRRVLWFEISVRSDGKNTYRSAVQSYSGYWWYCPKKQAAVFRFGLWTQHSTRCDCYIACENVHCLQLAGGGNRSAQDAVACQKCWPAVNDMPDVYKRPCRDYGTSCCAADSPFFKMKQIKGSVLECTSSIRT